MADAPVIRVLVVDDDADTRANLRDILELDDYQVDAAATAAEALDRGDWRSLSVIILDRRLPDGSAEELLPRLKQLAPDAAIMIVTGHADRSGPHDLNVALSQRRLDRVRAYLLSNGVPETFLVSQAMGEDCPLTDTADGVSEDSNRRVEVRMIVFSTPRAIARALECDTRWTH